MMVSEVPIATLEGNPSTTSERRNDQESPTDAEYTVQRSHHQPDGSDFEPAGAWEMRRTAVPCSVWFMSAR
jgi:hypothetical protein